MSFRQIVGSSVCLALLVGCSGSSGKSKNGGGNAVGVPPGSKADPYVEPEKLSLSAVKSDPAAEKNFDFKVLGEMTWISASEVLMAHADGKSVVYDFKNAAWSSVHTNPTITEYTALYDFRDAGSYATTAEIINFHKAGDPIVRLKLSDELKSAELVGTNPGFVAYKPADTINVVLTSGEAANLFVLSAPPAGLKLVYPCNRHCLVWGFDGSKIQVYFKGTGWLPLSQTINLPAGETIARMAVSFRLTNNPVAVESIFAQTASGKLFAQVAGTVTKSDPNWQDVQALSSRFCVECHLDDGFDKEVTWKKMKSLILGRLQLPMSSKNAMPPPETTIGKEMSQGERATIVAWVSKQTQLEGDTTGGSVTDPVADGPLTGAQGTLIKETCVFSSCHTIGGSKAYWITLRSRAIERVTNGSMPQRPEGKVLSAAEKTAVIAALNSLK